MLYSSYEVLLGPYQYLIHYGLLSRFFWQIYRRNLTADIPKDLKIVRDEDFELEEPEVQRRVEHHDCKFAWLLFISAF